MTKSINSKITPEIGAGIYLTADVAQILQLPSATVRRWLNEFWDGRFANDFTYSFGDKKNKAVNFYTLIEFYTFYQLKENGFSTQKIQKFHAAIAKELNTRYPFARNIHTDGKYVWYEYLGELIKADGKLQFDLQGILAPFLKKIQFGKNDLAEKYFPLDNSKNVVVDPKHQFGQPVIHGKNIRTEVLKKLYDGGETPEHLGVMYDLTISQVEDALKYYKLSA
jgi:uncharacterized protein (DUF433 family)